MHWVSPVTAALMAQLARHLEGAMDAGRASLWLNSLPLDQHNGVKEFFKGTGEEQLQRVTLQRLPTGLRRATLEGYLTHVIEPVLAHGRDFGSVMIKGHPTKG